MIDNSKLRKNGESVEIRVDDISGLEFEIDWERRLINNVTFANKKVIGVKKLVTHPYKYRLEGQIRTMTNKNLLVFGIKDLKTGRRRLTIKDEITNMAYPLSPPNVAELIRIASKWILEKEEDKISIPDDEDKWLTSVFSERYAGKLISMILESPSYGVTVKEVKERFNFSNEQKARNVLFKFKKLGFLVAQRTATKESFYMPTIERERLVRFIERFYKIGDETHKQA